MLHAYRASLQLHSTYHVHNVNVVERLIGKSSLTFSTLCWWKSKVCRWPVGAIVRIKLKIEVIKKELPGISLICRSELYLPRIWNIRTQSNVFWLGISSKRFQILIQFLLFTSCENDGLKILGSVNDNIVSCMWQDLHQRLPGSRRNLHPERTFRSWNQTFFIFFGPYFASSRSRSESIKINKCRAYNPVKTLFEKFCDDRFTNTV